MSEVVIGAVCVVERRFGFEPRSNPPRARWERQVVKLTPKRAYLAGGRDWFGLDDPEREVKPRYGDYRTEVVEIRRPSQPSSKPQETDR